MAKKWQKVGQENTFCRPNNSMVDSCHMCHIQLLVVFCSFSCFVLIIMQSIQQTKSLASYILKWAIVTFKAYGLMCLLAQRVLMMMMMMMMKLGSRSELLEGCYFRGVVTFRILRRLLNIILYQNNIKYLTQIVYHSMTVINRNQVKKSWHANNFIVILF